MIMSKALEFSSNWNGKLQCQIFHTLRRTSRFEVGDKAEISLNGKLLGVALCVSKERYANASSIPETICYLDTGYSKQETTTILGRMYKTDDPDIMPIYGYLFEWIQTTAEKTNLKPVVQLALTF